MGLMLHCGAERVTRDQLAAVVTPPPSNSHFPVPHIDLYNLAVNSFKAWGHEITSESHGLTKDGNRYFGYFDLKAGPGGDYGYAAAIRGSHDKSMSKALAFGTHVFCCDNMALDGEITMRRKHTRFIMRDLERLIYNSIGKLAAKQVALDHRIAAYKACDLDDRDADHIATNAMLQNVITTSQYKKVITEYRSPTHEEFEPRTLWSLFNAVTEVSKGTSDLVLVHRTQKLHRLCDRVVDAQSVTAV